MNPLDLITSCTFVNVTLLWLPTGLKCDIANTGREEIFPHNHHVRNVRAIPPHCLCTHSFKFILCSVLTYYHPWAVTTISPHMSCLRNPSWNSVHTSFWKIVLLLTSTSELVQQSLLTWSVLKVPPNILSTLHSGKHSFFSHSPLMFCNNLSSQSFHNSLCKISFFSHWDVATISPHILITNSIFKAGLYSHIQSWILFFWNPFLWWKLFLGSWRLGQINCQP